MGSLDFGKLTTIALIFFIVVFFFGEKLQYWYEHKEDLKFKINNLVYTKEDFDMMDQDEQKLLLDEVASLCVRKHFADNLSCDNTAYWLANSLEDKGVESTLAIAWMKTCSDACESGKKPVGLEEGPDKRSGT